MINVRNISGTVLVHCVLQEWYPSLWTFRPIHGMVTLRLKKWCAFVHVRAYGVFLHVVKREQMMDVLWQLPFLFLSYSTNPSASCLSRLSCLPASKSRCHWHSSPATLITSDGQFPLKRGPIYCATECAEGFLGRWARIAEMERRRTTRTNWALLTPEG